MKRQIIYAAAGALLVSGLVSCDDFLTEDTRGKENLDTYFSSAEEVESYTNGCYFEIAKDDWWQIYNCWLLSDMTTDDMWDGNTTQSDGYQDVSHFMPTAANNDILQNFWGARYQGISTCNIGIAGAKKAPIDENVKNIRIAEMRFLRAFFYFDLVRNFGGVPLITTQVDNTEGIGRSSQAECYEFIQKELEEVANILPQRSELSAEDLGRATRGAALGILGKAYLYDGNFEMAKKTLYKIIDEKEYSLMEDFGDVWSAAANNNKESIFEVQTMYNGDLYNTGSSLSVITGCRNGIGDGWSWGQPTSDLENAYIAAGDTERLRWTIIKTGCTEIAGENQFSQFVANNEKTYPDGVNNYDYTIYMETFGWTASELSSTYIIDPKQHKSARIIRKYFLPLDQRPDIYLQGKLPLNHRILRYADVLLMYAEACNETNDDSQARWALNEVRRRVNLTDVTTSGDALRQDIRKERRLELAFEQCRLYDIRRWTDSNGKKAMCNIMGPDGSFVKYNLGDNADKYEKWNQGEPSSKGTRFQENRDLLWPIPAYEIDHSNGAIIQNPNF